MPGKKANMSPVAQAIASATFLRDVGPDAAARLADMGMVRHYRKGTYLCHQGEPAPEVFFLIDGRIEVNSIAANGTRAYHATVDAPQFVGELGPLGDMPRTASLVALTDSEVWTAGADDFVDFLVTEVTAARAVIRALARQFQEQQAFVDDLLFLDLKGRVAKRLLQMATPDLDRLPDDGTVVPEVTQADLASLCGGSRENVTRILKELERRGMVRRDGHRYVLKKVASLAKIADL
jgi:CRP/FNR family cyclic AMP-dependent transcriptional regulator